MKGSVIYMALLKRKGRMLLPYPLVTCPNCNHRGTPVAMQCEVCGYDLSNFYV